MEMKGFPKYEAGFRYNYGAVDYYEGKVCMSNTLAGLKPQKLADEMEGKLNEAVNNGWQWARKQIQDCKKGNNDKEVINCIMNEFKL